MRRFLDIKKLLWKESKNTKRTRNVSSKKSNTLNFFQVWNKKVWKYKKRNAFQLQIPTGTRNFWIYYKIFLWILPIGIILYALLWPTLRVENILVSRQDKIVDINQAYESLNYIRWKNILFIESSNLIERLKKSQKSIKNIQIKAQFPNSLSIIIWSFDIAFQTDRYYILQNGLLIEKEDIDSDAPYIIISKSSYDSYSTENKISADDIISIRNIIQWLQKNILWFTIQNMYYAGKEHELIISHTNGNIFIFDLLWDLEKQVEKLSIYHTDNEDINLTRHIYTDVRIPDKIFICPLEREFTCINNMSQIYGKNVYSTVRKDLSQSSQ